MAKATVPPPVERPVTLELSPQEAAALAVVLSSIGGDPTWSPRKFTDAINEALEAVGYIYSTGIAAEFYSCLNRNGSSLSFNDFKFGKSTKKVKA